MKRHAEGFAVVAHGTFFDVEERIMVDGLGRFRVRGTYLTLPDAVYVARDILSKDTQGVKLVRIVEKVGVVWRNYESEE